MFPITALVPSMFYLCSLITLKYNAFVLLFLKTPKKAYLIKALISWAPSSEFVSSSIPSLQILTAHAQPFRGARDLAFCLKVPLDSLLVWASSEGSGETARMRRLAWTFAARIGDKYQIRLTRSSYIQCFYCLLFQDNQNGTERYGICIMPLNDIIKHINEESNK